MTLTRGAIFTTTSDGVQRAYNELYWVTPIVANCGTVPLVDAV